MQVFVSRHYPKILSLTLVLSMFGGIALAQTNPGSPMGWWLDHTGKAGVFISQCGKTVCGRIEWLRKPLNKEGKPVLDIHNEDASLRTREVCGLWMLGNFVADGPNVWDGGWIYDPASGKTYRSVIHMEPDGTLHVRGYVGIPLFGRSETWTRPAVSLTPCKGG